MAAQGKIVYPSGSQSPTTFTFQWPARNQPAFKLKRYGSDTISGDGHQQSITQFVDSLFTLEMPFIAKGTDIANWNAFALQAIQRVAFDFYPDADSSSHQTWICQDDALAGEYVAPGLYKLSMNMRLVVS